MWNFIIVKTKCSEIHQSAKLVFNKRRITNKWEKGWVFLEQMILGKLVS